MAITAKSPDDGAARASTAQEIAEADTATTARLVAYRQEIGLGAVRSTVTASRSALGALMRRDLVVLRKDVVIFCLRTVIQPFLFVFVFLYVFPTIGRASAAPATDMSAAVAESADHLDALLESEPVPLTMRAGSAQCAGASLGATARTSVAGNACEECVTLRKPPVTPRVPRREA